MRSKTSLVAIAVLTALLLAVGAVLPAVAQTAGTISVDKAYVSPTGSVTVTVKDADENHIIDDVARTTITTTADLQAVEVDVPLASGEQIFGTPTVRNNQRFNVSVFSRAGGILLVTSLDTVDAQPIIIDYQKTIRDTVDVNVTSPNSQTGITLTLTETDVSTGEFKGIFIVSRTTTGGAQIQAVPGQEVTVRYDDDNPSGGRTARVRVEGTEPIISLVSPAHRSFGTNLTPRLTVDVTDADSGVKKDTISFNVAGGPTASPVGFTDIANGFRAVVTLSNVPNNATTRISWYVAVEDNAGNVGRSDADRTKANSQDYELIVDRQAPDFSGNGARAFAGQWWDASITGKDKTQTNANKSKNTSVAVAFNEILPGVSESIDGATVAPTDFELDSFRSSDGTTSNNVAPTAAQVFPGAPNTIFLTVPPMAGDAKPNVVLISGVSDTAGNAVVPSNTTLITATDRQAPVITLVSPASQLAKASAKVVFSSNETLGATPTVYVNATGTDAQGVPTGGRTSIVTLVATNQWETTISSAGVNAVQILARDGNNDTLVGELISTAKFPTAKGIVVYVDDALPSPAVTSVDPLNNARAEVSEPFFIAIDFSNEGKEYGLDASGNPTIASVATDLDVNGKVTLTKLMLDGEDVLNQTTTTNMSTYTLAVSGISIGNHTLVLNAEDEAGNKLANDLTTKFQVIARSAYKLNLRAGWNLASLPGDPVDGSLDSVFSSPRVNRVLTYDPNDPNGPWLVATRDADGIWSAASTITNIDSKHAYWINSSGGETISTLLALVAVGTGATPPTVSVSPGWNLVPVIDLRQRAQNTAIDAAAYLTSVSWKVAYTYDPSNVTLGPWVRLLPGGSTDVKVGGGYWVWVTGAGTLVP